MSRICCISDQHGQLFDLPECDLVLNAGDICPNYRRGTDIQQQAVWLNTVYRQWREGQPHMIAIWGNHDFVGESPIAEACPQCIPFELPNDAETTFNGLRIYGTPWTRTFYNWAFMESEDQLGLRWQAIPEGLDLLLVHGPPQGHVDRAMDGFQCGSTALLYHIERAQPRVVVCGHIHEARGESVVGNSRILNVSSVDERYRLRSQPYTMLDLEPL